MKTLPYFRWFPADAETDNAYSALDDRELGFFHRCLNRSWLNDGLPADREELARTMKVSRVYLEKLWPRVSKLFQEADGKIFNRRQEEERTKAKTKSETATNSVRTRYERSFERSSDELPRALARAECVSVSVSDAGFVSRKRSPEEKPKSDASMRFTEFWKRYPLKDVAENLSAGIWLGLVTIDVECAVFACLERYLASDQVARGIVKSPNNWLHDCSRANWECVWPAAQLANGNGKPSDGLTEAQRIAKAAEKIMRDREARKNVL